MGGSTASVEVVDDDVAWCASLRVPLVANPAAWAGSALEAEMCLLERDEFLVADEPRRESRRCTTRRSGT